MRFVESTLSYEWLMNLLKFNVLFIQWSCWKLTSTSFQEIIINNEGSGSRVNHAKKFKANQQRNSKPISREIQSNRHKHSKSVEKKKKEKKKKKKKFRQYQVSAAEPQSKVATLERSWSGPRRAMLTLWPVSQKRIVPSNISRKHLTSWRF